MIAMPTVTQEAQTLAQAPIPQIDQERKRAMKEAWKAYEGDFQKPLKVTANQPDDNVLSNRCAPIVDKGVSFLFGKVLKLECADNEKQDFVDGLWGDDDDRMTLLAKIAINGGAFGQVFLKLIPAQGSMKYPRIVNLDPRNIRIVTDPEDCDLHLAYIIEYPGSSDWQKRQIIARVDPDNLLETVGDDDPEDTWTITNYVKRGQSGAWMQSGEQIEWEYPFAPIFTCQNLPNPNEAWGKADLTHDIIGLNKVLNFVQSNTSRIVKFHAHPITYATGLSSTQIQIGVDDLICLPSPESKLEKLAAMENFAGLLSIAETLRSDMDEQSRVPAVALGRLADLPKGNISGVALQLLFQPLLEKTVQKQRLYGRLIREVSRAALVLSGKLSVDGWEDEPIEPHWQNLLPVDDLAAAQTALLLKQLGISDQTIQSQLGYDPDDELEKSADEDSKKMTLYSRGQGFPPAQPGQQQAAAGQPGGVQGTSGGQESPFLGGQQQ